MFEDAAVGMYQSDPEGRLLTVNRALGTMFGYHPPEQMLMQVTEIPRKSNSTLNLREEFSRLLTTEGVVHDFEYQALRSEGYRYGFSKMPGSFVGRTVEHSWLRALSTTSHDESSSKPNCNRHRRWRRLAVSRAA